MFIVERWIDSVVDVVRVNEQIMYVKLVIGKQIIENIVSDYAPQVDLCAEEKDDLELLSTHSLDPCLCGESDHPAFGPPTSISLHLASSSITPAGSVYKSRGDSVVCMWVQLKR